MGIGIAAGRCCCGNVGFDRGKWDMATCFNAEQIVENVALNLDLLEQCAVLFAGNNNTCGNAIRFAAADWARVYAWIAGGGRMFIAAEHSGDYDPADDPAVTHVHAKCLQDMTTLNDFLIGLDSTLEYIGGDLVDFATKEHAADKFCVLLEPGAAQIASEAILYSNRFGEVDPGSVGTVVYRSRATYADKFSEPIATRPDLGLRNVVVAEPIGKGLVFLSGDSNHWYCASGCDFVTKLLDNDSNNLL